METRLAVRSVTWFSTSEPGARLPRDTLRTRRSALHDLSEFQLDRGCPAEDRNRDLEAAFALIDLFDHPLEAVERPVGNFDLLADVEADKVARRDLALLAAAD